MDISTTGSCVCIFGKQLTGGSGELNSHGGLHFLDILVCHGMQRWSAGLVCGLPQHVLVG